MELKNYQKQVINDLEIYLATLDRVGDPGRAFTEYWTEQWYARPDTYFDRVPGVPYTSLKVPTAGGKTIIAVHALGKLVDRIPVGNPRVVLWFVPWDTILTQTLRAFRDTDHPYRRRLDEMFNGRVSIFDKDAVLSGASFNASSVLEETSIIVLSIQSFRAKNKESRKVNQENGNLYSFAWKYETGVNIEWADETSLLKVLHNLNPIIVIDESHRAETDLSREMIVNLNPRYILGLTATPQKDANIISYTDAIKLKDEQMIKLPVVAYNLPSRESVIEKAVHLRINLENRAKELELTGGKYIRPIVLFQAESRTKDEAINYDKIKEKLIQAGIPANEIAIKVADKDEISHYDLLSRDCPIRYIITVDALKEGWDCPFSYILASLANRTSVMNVTQILGRVLRQPYARSTLDPRLNLSYVLSSSIDFHATIDEIIRWLGSIGFSKEDLVAENLDTTVSSALSPEMEKMAIEFGQSISAQPSDHDMDSPEDFDITRLSLTQIEDATVIDQMLDHANAVGEQFLAEVATSIHSSVSRELREKANIYKIKPSFLEIIQSIDIPQFFPRDNMHLSLFDAKIPLDKEELSSGFTLATADANIILEWGALDMYKIDLARESGELEYGKIGQHTQKLLLDYIDSLAPEDQINTVAWIVRKYLSKWDILWDTDLINYIERVLKQANESTIEYIKKSPYNAADQIKKRLELLVETHREKQFDNLRNADKIILAPSWRFRDEIILPSVSSALEKSLYEREWDMNGFERTVVEQLATLDNIVFWHRNEERRDFCINGWINHYPDFIIVTQSGKIIAIETKWGDRDNSDSRNKLKLGKTWESLSNGKCKYFMVFQDNPIAESHTLSDIIEIIKDL
jgi:type III restriction enzyme